MDGGSLMSDNQFFKPTVLYKEYMILDMIEKNPNITQREMGKAIGIAVSMINDYLNDYEKKGYIKRKYFSTKTVEYFVREKGIERKKLLNIEYLHAAQSAYASAKSNIEVFLNQISQKGFRRILLYGAGEVAEILLQVIQNDSQIPIIVAAVIDDDPKKQGLPIVNTPIIKLTDIFLFDYDGVLISSHSNRDEIYKKLLEYNFQPSKIIRFFDY